MVKITQKSKVKSQKYGIKAKRRGNTIIAIVVGALALIFFAFAIVYYVVMGLPNAVKAIGEMIFGGSSASAQNTSAAALEPIDCSGAKVPKIYLPTIKQAAKVYLKGDEAVIIAVISHESNWRANAMSDTGAVGIGQFVAPTAQGLKDSAGLFKGLTITKVPRAAKIKVTPAEKAAFLQNYPNSGRLHPGPSIEALAYKMKNALASQNGNLRKAYAINYHTIGKNGEHEAAAYAAADKIVDTYNKVKAGGGCKELKDIPGQLGEDIRKLTATKN